MIKKRYSKAKQTQAISYNGHGWDNMAIGHHGGGGRGMINVRNAGLCKL